MSVALRNWFDDEELRACPNCGQDHALPAPRGGFWVCLDCGVLTPDGQPLGDFKSAPRLLGLADEPEGS